MTNTHIKNILIISISLFYSCSNLNKSNPTTSSVTQPTNEYNLDSLLMTKINKTDDEWKNILSTQEFNVTRKKGTEPSFTGEYHDSKQSGVYHCKCCDMPLFLSESKFDSGTGWPSFYQTFDPVCISEHKDFTHGMTRTEVTCARCEAHLGHLFPDGPKPTGLRYCINSISLVLKDK